MTRQSQISIAVSLALHLIALLISAGVRLYTDTNIGDSMPVTFVGQQKTMPLQRSLSVRPMISLDASPQRHAPEQYTIHTEHRSSVDFCVSSPEKVFSTVADMGREMFRDMNMQRPSVESRDHLFRPMATDLPNAPHLRGIQIQPRITEGRDLLGDIIPAQVKQTMKNTDDILQKFALTVRTRIESKKRYPTAARRFELEGRTGIKMTILKDGRLEKVEIVESSGYKSLDKAALQSVQNAAPFPPIPKAARLNRIEMRVHLIFKLSQGE